MSLTNASKINADWMHYQSDKIPHSCERTREKDDLNVVYPGNSLIDKIRRNFRKLFLCPHNNVRALRLFRSHASIDYERSRQLRLYWYMIHPFSYFIIFVEVAMILAAIHFIYVSLWLIAFPVRDLEQRLKLVLEVQILIDEVINLTFIAINFFTGIIQEETRRVEMQFRSVVKMYLRGYFILDLICVSGITIPHIYYVFIVRDFKEIPAQVRMVVFLSCACKIFRMMSQINHTTKVSKLCYQLTYRPPTLAIRQTLVQEFQCMSAIEDTFDYTANICQVLHISHEKGAYVLAVVGLICYFHFTACLCFFVASTYDIGHLEAWISQSQLRESQNVAKMYRISMDRTILETLGMCIKVPLYTTEDQITTMIFTWTGAIFFLVVVGKIMQLTTARNSSVSHFEDVLTQVEQYMESRKLPKKLQGRVLEFYHFRFQGAYYREAAIVKNISRQLRQDYRFHQCRSLVEKVAFFGDLPTHVLMRIVAVMQTEFFLHGETVIHLNTSGSAMYFIKSGTVAVFSAFGEEVCHLEDGNHFGEIALVLAHFRRVAEVVTIENCELYRLEREDFNAVMAPFPEFLNRIRETALRRLERMMLLEASHKTTAEIAAKSLISLD